jgi:hypothetical protein
VIGKGYDPHGRVDAGPPVLAEVAYATGRASTGRSTAPRKQH